MNSAELLSALGDDAAKWAEAFRQIVVRRNILIDDGLMTGWFANAIEHSTMVRQKQWIPIKDHPSDHFTYLVWHRDHGKMVAFVDATGEWWPVPAIEPLGFIPTAFQYLPDSPWHME
jgi:hypothetical protein